MLRAEQALEKEEFLSLSDAAQAEVKRRKSNKSDTGLRWTHERVLAVTRQLKESLDEILTVPSEFTQEERERLLDVSKHFAGRLDKEGVHASAILVTPDAVAKYCPIEGCTSTNTSTGKREYIRVAAFEYHTLEAMGLLKLDILGLRTLDIIDDCLKMIDEPLSLESIPMDDAKTYRMYADGNTTGVFQMESPGMQKIAKELHVNCFNDLSVLVALYRPGPLDSGMLQQYIDAKNGKVEVKYPCKAVEEIAGSTYGVLVYQEQIMKIAMKMAGYNLGQADALRKVIGRKEFTKIKAAVAEFIAGCERNGYSHEVASEVAKQIEAAGRYCFNLAHSVSYGKLSYKTAYLKAHYPVQYMCALLNSRSDQKKLLPYINECKRMKIKVLPPDLRKGNREWTVDGDAIRVGLCYIKGVGDNLKMPNDMTWDGIVSSNNKGITEALIKAGALDFVGKSRGWMLANLQSTKETQERKAHCLERIDHYKLIRFGHYDAKAQQKAQRMLDQWYAKLSNVEFNENAEKKYDAISGEMSVLSFSFHELPKVLIGTPKDIHEFTDKNGGLMARITFATDYGDIGGMVFASAWKKAKYHDRFRGWQRGITIEAGHRYEFMVKKGIIVDAREA